MRCNQSSIHDEIIRGNKHQISQLIKDGFDIDSLDQLHWSPLHLAVRLGKIDIVRLLLKENASTEAKTLENYTPLHFAVLMEDTELVKVLLQHGADVNATCKSSKTVLHYAIQVRNESLVEILLNHGSKANTPLWALLDEKHIQEEDCKMKISKILQLLLENNAQHWPNQILHFATSNGLTEAVKYYVKKSMECKKASIDTIHWVISKGNEEMLLMLLTNGMNPDVQIPIDGTPLLLAIAAKREDIVKCLISNGANVDLSDEHNLDNIPINLAVKRGFLRIARLLLQNGAMINTKISIPPIYHAIEKCSREALELLVEYGADTNIKISNNPSITPLSLALLIRQWEIVKFLIANEAETKPEYVFTAVNNGCNNDLIDLLVVNGGDVNFKSPNDLRTPLHIACLNGLPYAAKTLLECGTDTSYKDSEKNTPMECALDANQLDVYKIIFTFDKEV